MRSEKSIIVGTLVFAVVLLLSSSLATVADSSSGSYYISSGNKTGPVIDGGPKSFAFVSNFETLTLEGWNRLSGQTPTVVTGVSYSGEPSLKSSSSLGSQIDYANKNFIKGLTEVSFQAAILSSPNSAGYFGLGQDNHFVALVGVHDDVVVAGRDLSSLRELGRVPTTTAQPKGWVYLVANVLLAKNGNWIMQVFVDRTDQFAARIPVPSSGSYSEALIETTRGTVYYSDIAVSSSFLGTLFPGWNNMQGYGQGGACLCSSLNVKLLPNFSNLSADMTLSSWSVPQANILSFQINSSNETGTIIPKTCVGFFQIGVDINPDGRIAPWYVKGNNCVAHYFAGFGGVSSPRGTKLSLSIVLEPAKQEIAFKIVDASISRTFTASIPYSGGAFDSMFTQLEFQPCCNTSNIANYAMLGKIYNIQITTLSGLTEALRSSYMIPWSVDAPPNWDFSYYQNGIAGYDQSSV